MFSPSNETGKHGTNPIKIKVRLELERAGTNGRTRTELLSALRVPRDVLSQVLDELIAAFEVASRSMRKRAFALGRPVTRYWLTAHAPKDLTPPPPSAMPVTDNASPDPGTPSGRTCRQCGVAIPRRGLGPVPNYCSDACKQLARAGGVTVADFLARASNPLVFARCARRLVEIDLLCRGLEASPVLDQGGFLAVYDNGGNAALLHVVPISDAGAVPVLDEYTHAACVYRDGRIVYGGRVPLVQDELEVQNEGAETGTRSVK